MNAEEVDYSTIRIKNKINIHQLDQKQLEHQEEIHQLKEQLKQQHYQTIMQKQEEYNTQKEQLKEEYYTQKIK